MMKKRTRRRGAGGGYVISEYTAVLIFLMFYGSVAILFHVFFFHVRERSDSYFDSFGWQSPISAGFSLFTYLLLLFLLFLSGRQKGLELDGDNFVFCFFIMSYVCVFTTVGEKNTVSCVWAGVLGWAWFGFDTFVYFFFPLFFIPSLATLLYFTCLVLMRDETSMDFSQTPQRAVAAWMRVSVPVFFLYIFNFVPGGGGEVGWLVNGCLYFFFPLSFPGEQDRIG